MDTSNHPELTAVEWNLVLQLLEREQALLPVEIHHTATRKMREALKARRDLVDNLVARVREAVPPVEDSTWAATANC